MIITYYAYACVRCRQILRGARVRLFRTRRTRCRGDTAFRPRPQETTTILSSRSFPLLPTNFSTHPCETHVSPAERQHVLTSVLKHTHTNWQVCTCVLACVCARTRVLFADDFVTIHRATVRRRRHLGAARRKCKTTRARDSRRLRPSARRERSVNDRSAHRVQTTREGTGECRCSTTSCRRSEVLENVYKTGHVTGWPLIRHRAAATRG